MHLAVLRGATAEFQNSRKLLKNATFLKRRKESTISKISIVRCFFKSDRPVCNHLKVNFIKKKLFSKPFFSKKSIFAFLNLKTSEVKENWSKAQLNVCPLKCTYSQTFNFISAWSEIMSLKSDRLELGLSIYPTELQSNRQIALMLKLLLWTQTCPLQVP